MPKLANPTSPTSEQLDLVRASLARTAMACFRTDEDQPLAPAEVHRLMIFVLERDYLGDSTINAPPGCAKTTWMVAHCAKKIGDNPNIRISYVSAATTLARKQSKVVRETVQGNRVYRALFPNVVPDPDRGWSDTEWYVKRTVTNLADPTFSAYGLGGMILGSRADLMILDDLNTEEQVRSELQRGQLREFVANTLRSRLVPKTGRMINVQTRWHEEDVTGWTLENHWTQLRFQALAENDGPEQYAHLTVWNEKIRNAVAVDLLRDGWRYEVLDEGSELEGDRRWVFRIFLHAAGPAIWDRYPLDGKKGLYHIRMTMGARAWALTYQSDPIAEGGNVIPTDSFGHYDWAGGEHRRQNFVAVWQAWDTAFSEKTSADYSVCCTMALDRAGRFWLLDVFRKRLSFPDLKAASVTQFLKWLPQGVLVEDKASGQSLIQELRRPDPDDRDAARIPVIGIKPDRDKLSRAYAVTGYIEAGKVLVPEQAPFMADFLKECALFPGGAHDDQVDAFVYVLQRLITNTGRLAESLIDPQENTTVFGNFRARMEF